jgi:glutathione peroxidase
MAAKVSIRNNPHPVYQWLQQKQLNGRMDTEVKWNFHKYLLDEDGQLVQSLSSSTSPFDDAILNWIGS